MNIQFQENIQALWPGEGMISPLEASDVWKLGMVEGLGR